jgi:molybdopterin-synthase adenylyltransferase
LTHISLFDFDSVEDINLDRLLHATEYDAILKRPKVDVLSRALKKSATAEKFIVDAYETSIVEIAGFQSALDCDVLFSCVDRPWPRAMLNFIAYAHLIPVVDGGIAIKQKKTGKGMKSADWKAHIAAPGRPCLECLKQYDPGNVSTDRDGYFDDPNYIQGLEDEHSIKRNENVFAFSMSAASFEVLQFLSMMISPMSISNPGPQMYHFVNGRLDVEEDLICNNNCLFLGLTAKGDNAGFSFVGRHTAAEKARNERKNYHRSVNCWIKKVKYFLKTFTARKA